jgi:hypothetical protein
LFLTAQIRGAFDRRRENKLFGGKTCKPAGFSTNLCDTNGPAEPCGLLGELAIRFAGCLDVIRSIRPTNEALLNNLF